MVTVYDPKGGENVTLLTVEAPNGTVAYKRPPWMWLDGNYVTIFWMQSSPTPPVFGRYVLTATNADDDSASAISLPTDWVCSTSPSVTFPSDHAVIADTAPMLTWEPAVEAFPRPLTHFDVEISGPESEWMGPDRGLVWFESVGPEARQARFNEDHLAGVSELTPGTAYQFALTEGHLNLLDPGGAGRPSEYRWDNSIRFVDFTIASSALTSFEGGRYPWAGFSAGPDQAEVRREVFVPAGAHSGAYAMVPDVTGQAISGLRLELPVGPTAPAGASLRTWVYVDDRTVGDASTFFGFGFDDGYPNSSTGWSNAVGWEVRSATASRLQLGGTYLDLPLGLQAGGWHLVRVNYHRADNSLRLWLDGNLVADEVASGIAGEAAHYAILGGLGEGMGARQRVRFDDSSLLPMLDTEWPPEIDPFARLEGMEETVEGQPYSYSLRYGNGYPVLGTDPVTETLADPIYVALSLPAGYSLADATPAPARVDGAALVWELPIPAFGQDGYIYLDLVTPTGIATPVYDTIYAWATTDPSAAAADPPAPPDWTAPSDATWGWPQDVLRQIVFPGEDLTPDVWVRKDGPRYASPGDTIYYAVTVGNRDLAPATDVVVRDQMPAELGGGDRILANLDHLNPGETWRGVVSGGLAWGLPQGTLILNRAYVPTCPAEVSLDNNVALRQTTVLAAHDPNSISASPQGGVERGETLTYTLECENTGAGTAYGVYASVVLDPGLNAGTLVLPAGMSYDLGGHTVTWEVGTLASGAGAGQSFTVAVASNARRARPIMEQATVYFPSVPEETPTNVVLNVVNSTFSDVPWDHWAILPVEQTFENGIVGGFGDGTYRPAEIVDRAQMAVYLAKALHLPTAPYEGQFVDDVPITQWAWPWIEALAREDLVQGYDATHYGPNAVVTRDQMAVYVARGLVGGMTIPTGPAVGKFVDVPDANPGPVHWAYDEVEYCVAGGITAGYDLTHYLPDLPVDRGQMAVYVARAFRLPM
jgi:uncharacterized repeat protein (TIGR01451 family)